MIRKSIFIIPLFFIVSVIVGNNAIIVYASEKTYYTDYKGDKLTQDEFDERMDYCSEMKIKEILPKSNSIVNCNDWVLTDDGEYIITKYIIDKALYDDDDDD